MKFVRITDGSLLDTESRDFLEDLGRKEGLRFWVEMVRETGEAGLVLTESLEV